MATTSNEIKITRDYIDNVSIKKFTTDELVPKYFSDIDPSLRTVGMIGLTTEQVSNIGEDTFNTGSTLFRESFPNRAQIPESIYSHAAIFQLSNVFSTASTCNFLLVMEEAAIIKNMQENYDKDTGIFYFYIDKDTKIYVTDIPFTLDYDVEMRIVKKSNELNDDYLFSASYIMSDYKNSISEITDPYVKIRRSSDGYIALELKCHQCLRTTEYETILTSNVINYPIIDVSFTGKLAGFDILYKTETETSYSTQLTPLVIYSNPISSPFCFYQLYDENTLRITFNTKDEYFQPEYGSEFKIILYNTDGSSGVFDVYTGNDISIVSCDDNYAYANSYITAAKPITSSIGGKDQSSIDELQSLAVMGYRTANALTTDDDLNEYFKNYRYLYSNSEIKFIKKRNDISERIFSAFILMKNDDYIYHTNTLNLSLNLGDMENPEKTIYMMEPGILFTANDTDGYAKFLRDEEKSNQYYKDYLQAIEDGTIDYIDDNTDKTNLPAYLDRPASFAEYKQRNGIDDKLSVFDYKSIDLEKYDQPSDMKFLLINPFLIRFKKNPNLISLYMTYVSHQSLLDFTLQNTDSYVQFISYTASINRKFSREKKYSFSMKLISSISVSDQYPIVDAVKTETGVIDHYNLNDKFNVTKNDLRVILVITDSVKNICYTELYPTDYDIETENFTFSGDIFTDDHITSDGKLRILADEIYRDNDSGDYYKVYDNDFTLYNHFDKDDRLLESNIPVDMITEMVDEGLLKKWSNCVNMTGSDDILIPMDEVTCKIYTIYNRIFDDGSGSLEELKYDQTNNLFSEYDDSYKGYMWTNVYSTASDPFVFLRPLNNVRTNLMFKDFTQCVKNEDGVINYDYDIMDVDMMSIPFIRWSLIKDNTALDHFMATFLSQYNNMIDIGREKLRGESSIDVKFYNTYGRSKNFRIGEHEEILDTINLSLSFDIWFVSGSDILSCIPSVKEFIKSEVEKINSTSMNNLYISNLMRKIEVNFAFVDHIRFVSINKYPTTYQAVKDCTTDLNELTVEERRVYVPELLVIDLDDITLNDYIA